MYGYRWIPGQRLYYYIYIKAARHVWTPVDTYRWIHTGGHLNSLSLNRGENGSFRCPIHTGGYRASAFRLVLLGFEGPSNKVLKEQFSRDIKALLRLNALFFY